VLALPHEAHPAVVSGVNVIKSGCSTEGLEMVLYQKRKRLLVLGVVLTILAAICNAFVRVSDEPHGEL